MVVNKRRKSTRSHGSNTHGWGSNQRRGAGCRGGRGNAGSGMKADQRKATFWKLKEHFSKKGFHSKKPQDETINLRDLVEKLQTWEANKLITKEGDALSVNLEKLGYTKLLSAGKIAQKVKITVPKAAAKAIEKVKAAGGDVVNA
jgi:large subunit ribosomal protein L15